MKSNNLFSIVFLLLQLLILVSCKEIKKSKTKDVKSAKIEKADIFSYDSKERNIGDGVTKYIYIKVKYTQPFVKSLTLTEERTFTDEVLGTPSMLETKKYIREIEVVYKSNIFTITNYSEDKKHMKIDEVVALLEEKWSREVNYDSDLGELSKNIISAEAEVFDSYKEASISKNGR